METIKPILNIDEKILWKSNPSFYKSKRAILITYIVCELFSSFLLIISIIKIDLFWIIWSLIYMVFFNIIIYLGHILLKNVEKSIYLITDKRVIEKSSIVRRIDFSKAPSNSLKVEGDIVAVDISSIKRIIIKRFELSWKFEFYINLEKDVYSWITFRGITEFSEIKKILAKLIPFREERIKKRNKLKKIILLRENGTI